MLYKVKDVFGETAIWQSNLVGVISSCDQDEFMNAANVVCQYCLPIRTNRKLHYLPSTL